MSDVKPQNTQQKPQNEPQNNQKPSNDDGNNVLDKFEEIKNKYEKTIQDKDEKIQELEQKLKDKEGEVDTTITHLNEEVNTKLEQAEKLKELQTTVNELLQDKAEALVDKYINEGKLVPAQKDKALSLCLSDQDMFISLYENAPSVIDMSRKPKSKRDDTNIDAMVNYFK